MAAANSEGAAAGRQRANARREGEEATRHGTRTCKVVLSVSIGVMSMRHAAAVPLATAVRSHTGIAAPNAVAASRVSTPEFAAVSPKRDRGVCTNAHESPW